MMTIPMLAIQQDTLKIKSKVPRDTVVFKSDSLHAVDSLQVKKDTIKPKIILYRPLPVLHITDTTSVCKRNNIFDFTFYDSTNLISQIGKGPYDRFPFIFIEKNRARQAEEKAVIVKHLKQGSKLPVPSFHDDWIILIILAAAFLYSVVRSSSKGIFSSFVKFFLFRGINDPASRDIGGLFLWQSTIFNLISFLVLGLFGYMYTRFYGLSTGNISSILLWLISVGVIISAVTIRHFICIITGALSGQKEVFGEYLVNIYQGYRFSALLIFFVIILISYTTFLPLDFLLSAGIVILVLLYLLRVIRLLIIFINRNISIFYLILYLCALEILPVLILAKYFTGLI